MLVLKDRIINVPVMSLQTGLELAKTEKVIIDPRQLLIVGFFCQGSTLDHNPAILTIDDIREVGRLGFIVDSANVLMRPEDLVRMQPILRYNFTLEGKLVVDDTGHKIGKVATYTIDSKSYYIMQLQVQPSLLQSWDKSDVIIGRNQIIEITDTQVVVRAPTVKKEAQAPATLKRMVANPFKRAHPQPEVSHTSPTEAAR